MQTIACVFVLCYTFFAMATLNHFISDHDKPMLYPFGNYLRSMPISVAIQYIEALTRPGDLVLDPFGATPNVARAALALGRRAIILDSNPLSAWLARAMAILPTAEIDAALARLGDAMKDDAPIRAHIAQLYSTICAVCAKPTPADYFVIGRDVGPVRRHYTCTHCGATRDDPATDDDRARSASFDAHGLHYHIAFERVVPEGNPHVERIRKLLDLYTPRNLYALVTLTQKIDSLFHATRERNILLVLLLHLLDRGTSFYTEPEKSPQIAAHKQYVEFNLWREIEIAARELAKTESIKLAESLPDVLASDAPSAFIGRGNLQTIAREIPRRSVALVLSTQPMRRLGLLALAYFGGAWILGRAAMQSLAGFLETPNDVLAELRRYSQMLNETLLPLAQSMRNDARVVFAFDESSQLFIESMMLACATAHLKLESFVFQPRLGESARTELGGLGGSYRIAFCNPELAERGANGERELPSDDAREMWRPAKTPVIARANISIGAVDKAMRVAALDAGSQILSRRGEPLAFTWLHHAALERFARDGLLEQIQSAESKTPPGKIVHDAIVEGLREGYARDFDHITSAMQFAWRRNAPHDAPLIDRVEDAVREVLSRGEISFAELEDMINRQFPGDLTPEAGLIELCAETCATNAESDKAQAMEFLRQLGERLGFQISEFRHQTPDNGNSNPAICNFDLVWLDHGEMAHGFIWRARAQFSDLIQVQVAPACGYLIIPENLVALMQEKVRRLPHLADAFHESGWHFVRVPFAEKLLDKETLERNDVVFMTGLESVAEKTQLEMFSETTENR